jgi:hypothetical protein
MVSYNPEEMRESARVFLEAELQRNSDSNPLEMLTRERDNWYNYVKQLRSGMQENGCSGSDIFDIYKVIVAHEMILDMDNHGRADNGDRFNEYSSMMSDDPDANVSFLDELFKQKGFYDNRISERSDWNPEDHYSAYRNMLGDDPAANVIILNRLLNEKALYRNRVGKEAEKIMKKGAKTEKDLDVLSEYTMLLKQEFDITTLIEQEDASIAGSFSFQSYSTNLFLHYTRANEALELAADTVYREMDEKLEELLEPDLDKKWIVLNEHGLPGKFRIAEIREQRRL